MDNPQVFNESFLKAVAKKYSIDYENLKMCISDALTQKQQKNIDPAGVHLKSTEHFGSFVKKQEIKEVNAGTVVFYFWQLLFVPNSFEE